MRMKISAHEIKGLMRKNQKTIKTLAREMGLTQIRVREVRNNGVKGKYLCQDWIEALNH